LPGVGSVAHLPDAVQRDLARDPLAGRNRLILPGGAGALWNRRPGLTKDDEAGGHGHGPEQPRCELAHVDSLPLVGIFLAGIFCRNHAGPLPDPHTPWREDVTVMSAKRIGNE